MSSTRPSGNGIIPGANAAVSQEVVTVDERGRLHLLPRWTERLPWLEADAAADRSALMTFIEPGRFSIRSWEPHSTQIIARYDELSAGSDPDRFETMRLIYDRYGRLTVPHDRRPYLGAAALAHLGLHLERNAKSIVYVAVFPDQLHVLSQSYRNARLAIGDPGLDTLP